MGSSSMFAKTTNLRPLDAKIPGSRAQLTYGGPPSAHPCFNQFLDAQQDTYIRVPSSVKTQSKKETLSFPFQVSQNLGICTLSISLINSASTSSQLVFDFYSAGSQGSLGCSYRTPSGSSNPAGRIKVQPRVRHSLELLKEVTLQSQSQLK